MFGLAKTLIDVTRTSAPGEILYNDGKVAVFRASSLPKYWPDFP
jgi:hypothetical protein